MSRTITVKGIGTASARVDYVLLYMELRAKDMKYDKAMDKAAFQLSQLNDCLAAIGFEKKAVKTTSFDIETDYDSYKDEQGNYQRVFRGFVCEHKLKLAFDFEIEKLSQALSSVAKCLANPELSIEFTVKDPANINETLLREATINAKKKAELLCDASEVKLGQLLSIDYNWGELNVYSKTRYNHSTKFSMENSLSIDIEPEDIKVRDTATFVWEIV
ncbi:MAG: SIMPL domain-containing protein [Fibrobacter sp.]|nr:SIMPL domain-containing protein [Fibrobacter sp.]